MTKDQKQINAAMEQSCIRHFFSDLNYTLTIEQSSPMHSCLVCTKFNLGVLKSSESYCLLTGFCEFLALQNFTHS